MLLIFGLAVILLFAFVAYLVFAVFITKLIVVAFAGIAAALYAAIFFGLYSAFGDANVVGEILGSLVIGTTVLVLGAKAHQAAEKEKEAAAERARAAQAAALAWAEEEKRKATERALAEKAEAMLQAEAEKVARQKAGCPCGSGKPFEACHGSTLRSAFDTVVAPQIKQGWKALIDTINKNT